MTRRASLIYAHALAVGLLIAFAIRERWGLEARLSPVVFRSLEQKALMDIKQDHPDKAILLCNRLISGPFRWVIGDFEAARLYVLSAQALMREGQYDGVERNLKSAVAIHERNLPASRWGFIADLELLKAFYRRQDRNMDAERASRAIDIQRSALHR